MEEKGIKNTADVEKKGLIIKVKKGKEKYLIMIG